MFDPRNNLANEVSAQLIAHFGDKVFRTVIPRNIRLAEAPSFGKPALFHDKESRGALAYLALAGEMIRREEGQNGIVRATPVRKRARRRLARGVRIRTASTPTPAGACRAARAGCGPGLAGNGSSGNGAAAAGKALRQKAAAPRRTSTRTPHDDAQKTHPRPRAGGPARHALGAAAPVASTPHGEELARLPLDLLQRGRYQPRIDMRAETLSELADSIKAQGVVQPIVVRPLEPPGSGASQRYEIIAGERRWRAAQMAGLSEIPAVIRDMPDEAAIAMALIENIQRENLNPLEEARALARLIERVRAHPPAGGRGRRPLARRGEQPAAAARAGPGGVRAARAAHARDGTCARAAGPHHRRQQIEVALLVAKKGLSVRETEGAGAAAADPRRAAAGNGAAARDPNVERLEHELAEKLGARVAIQHSGCRQGQAGGELQQPGRARRASWPTSVRAWCQRAGAPCGRGPGALYNPAAFWPWQLSD